MTTFAEAVKSTPAVARTENGMRAKAHSGNVLVDLFYKIGASRGKSVTADFERAFQEDADLAMKIAFWSRDVRGGAGERQIFRDILLHLEKLHPVTLEKAMPFVAEFGRWDDLLIFKTEKFKHMAYTLIGDALRERNGLAAKWMPRQGPIAIEIRNFYGMTPKQYRKSLVALTNVVESKMCAQDWDGIEFGKLPSLASARYNKAFAKNATASYEAYKARLTKGTDKVNASAVYPYDVLKTLQRGDQTMAVKQWDALPNYMEGNNERVLPVCDVSGSMSSPAGNNANLSCMDVCISLGLYISERNEGKFKDAFVTFSESPKLQYLNGKLNDRYRQLQQADWGMSTNLEAVFTLVLNQATKFNLPESEMPTTLLIMSDMEFNQATRSSQSALDMIRTKYESAGYTMPKLVFWNIQSRNSGNYPVQVTDSGTALVSGFSPAILKSLLTGEDMSPVGIMNKTVHSARYEPITA